MTLQMHVALLPARSGSSRWEARFTHLMSQSEGEVLQQSCYASTEGKLGQVLAHTIAGTLCKGDVAFWASALTWRAPHPSRCQICRAQASKVLMIRINTPLLIDILLQPQRWRHYHGTLGCCAHLLAAVPSWEEQTLHPLTAISLQHMTAPLTGVSLLAAWCTESCSNICLGALQDIAYSCGLLLA